MNNLIRKIAHALTYFFRRRSAQEPAQPVATTGVEIAGEDEPQAPTLAVDPSPHEDDVRDVFAVAKLAINGLQSNIIGGDKFIANALLKIGPVVTDNFYAGDVDADFRDLPSICSVVGVHPDEAGMKCGRAEDSVYPLWGGVLEVPKGVFGDGVRFQVEHQREFQAHLAYWDKKKAKQVAFTAAVCVDRHGNLHFPVVKEMKSVNVTTTKVGRWGEKYNRKKGLSRFTGRYVPIFSGEYEPLNDTFRMLIATCLRVRQLSEREGACEVSMAEGDRTVRFLDDRSRMKEYYPPKARHSLSGKSRILHWVDSFTKGDRTVRGHYRGDDKFIHDGLTVRIRPMNWGQNPFGMLNIKPCTLADAAGDYGRRNKLISIGKVAKKIRKVELSNKRLTLREIDKSTAA